MLAGAMHDCRYMYDRAVKVREALRYVDDRRRADPQCSLPMVIDSAARQFDLTLAEQSELWRTLRGDAR
jgi:hypothetical protein